MLKQIYKKLPLPLKKIIWLQRIPTFYTIEVTNRCNIRCIGCSWYTTMSRPLKDMTYSEFMVIFEQIKNAAKNVQFYVMGEPLLNKHLFRMIRKCTDHGIKTRFSTNGMLLRDNVDAIIESGVSQVQVALDGLGKNHEKYRRGSDVEVIKDGIIALARRKPNSTSIRIQTLVSDLNRADVKDIRNFAHSHGCKFATKAMYLGQDQEAIDRNSRVLGRENLARYKTDTKFRRDSNHCYHLNVVIILSNGDVIPCDADWDGKYTLGNIFTDGLAKIQTGRKRINFYKGFYKRTNPLCFRCDIIDQGPSKNIN